MTARWWHGGIPGLTPGGLILPPSVTGRLSSADIFAAITGHSVYDHGMEPDRARHDRIYATRSRKLARAHAFAAASIRGLAGAVYLVEPRGAEPDPDFEPEFPGLCCQAPAAIILAVADPAVSMTTEVMGQIMGRYTTHETQEKLTAWWDHLGKIPPAYRRTPA